MSPPGQRTGPDHGDQGQLQALPSTDTSVTDRPALERVREALAEYECQPRGGDQLRARCPVHGSRGPTLSVRQGRAGALLYCHAGCTAADIMAALGLSWADVFDEPREARPWQPRRRPETRLERGYRVMVLAGQQAREAASVPASSAAQRVARAEDGCREDAREHYSRTMARLAALACDRAYVRAAYADQAARQLTAEQGMVLAMRAEDLARGAR